MKTILSFILALSFSASAYADDSIKVCGVVIPNILMINRAYSTDDLEIVRRAWRDKTLIQEKICNYLGRVTIAFQYQDPSDNKAIMLRPD